MKFIAVICFTLSCMLYQHTAAQTCMGETTVYTQSFGNGDQIIPLQKGSTSLNFQNSNLRAGEYTIRRKSNAAQFWHNAYDHTGDFKGKMLLVDASNATDVIYIDTIQGIKPNTTYSLSFAIMNTNIPGSYAQQVNTQVRIEAAYDNGAGQFIPLAQFESEAIPPTNNPSWNVVGGYVDLPPTAKAIRYTLRNTAGSGSGNTLALDDVTLIECASASTALLLPATLKSFNAYAKGATIELQWTSLNESNLEHYIIEKSMNGKSWYPLKTMAANGNTNLQKTYKWIDQNNAVSMQYYRLHMVDVDGKALFSPMIRVTNANTSSIELNVQNPLQHELVMLYKSSLQTNAQWVIKNLQGSPVQSGKMQLQKGDNYIYETLNKAIVQGLYILEITTVSGQKTTEKIIKN